MVSLIQQSQWWTNRSAVFDVCECLIALHIVLQFGEDHVCFRHLSMSGRSRKGRHVRRGSSLQPTELVVETRAQLRRVLDLSHAVFNVEGITSASSKRGWQQSAGHCVNLPSIPKATWVASFIAPSLLGLAAKQTVKS